MPDAFLHYSTSEIDVFLPTAQRDGYFCTKTQGFLYVTRASSKISSSTVLSRPKSALLFVGEAADWFVEHPAIDPCFFKRVFGQCVSEPRYFDWGWSVADCITDNEVLVISKIYPIPMKAGSRVDQIGLDSAQIRRYRMRRNYWLAWAAYLIPGMVMLTTLLWEPLGEFLLRYKMTLLMSAIGAMVAAVPVSIWLKRRYPNAALEATLSRLLAPCPAAHSAEEDGSGGSCAVTGDVERI